MADGASVRLARHAPTYVARPGLVWHTIDNHVPDSESLGQALGTGVLTATSSVTVATIAPYGKMPASPQLESGRRRDHRIPQEGNGRQVGQFPAAVSLGEAH
jgi:hypothetical protein